MLRIDTEDRIEEQIDVAPVRFSVAAAPPEALPQRSAYQAQGGANLVAGIGSALVVAGLLSGLLWIQVEKTAAPKSALVTLDLSPTPPPPPARAAPTPKPRIVKPQPLVVPPPVVSIPLPSPVAVVTSPVPAPPVIAAPPAPPSSPAATAAALAPAAAPADGGDLSSKMISAKPPSYPMESRRAHEEGTVVLTVLLGTDGRVADVSVAQSSGSDRLDHAALAAVKAWRWAPIVRNGAPMMVQGRVKIPFVLKR